MMSRYKQQQSAASESLLASHTRAEASARATADKGGLFVWDHATEMGMRGVKGAAALKKEVTAAFTLNDNFTTAGS